jgi:hypothetical protein
MVVARNDGPPRAQAMAEQQPWYRMFGLAWMDFFTGQPVTVDIEKDLSLKKQLLDVLLIRKEGAILDCRLPDGFEDLAHYNLVSFKSHRQTLTLFALHELVGHYGNLRKQVSPSMDEEDLLPVEQFRLFAVSARYPQQLAGELGADWRRVGEGVHDVIGLGLRIRVVVPNQLPPEEHNALLHLFSTSAERLVFAGRHYRIHSPDTSSLLQKLFQRIREEIPEMTTPLQEFAREARAQLLKELPVEQILEDVPIEKILERLSPEERVRGLSADELFRLAEKAKAAGEPAKSE